MMCSVVRAIAAFCMALTLGGSIVQASGDGSGKDAILMIPAIWVDPDGCQHWVMDDGWEGYMDIRLDRNGKPICTPQPTCAVVGTDHLFFGSNEYELSAAGRAGIANFFRTAGAASYVINGHTDNRASDAYNIELSLQRARAVAEVAAEVGATVKLLNGWGERKPIASNATAAGRAQNRRVEIDCLN
jgi:outer membrane protein OmpA-like peptidoglycan-associated protein